MPSTVRGGYGYASGKSSLKVSEVEVLGPTTTRANKKEKEDNACSLVAHARRLHTDDHALHTTTSML
ncbi:hypothetical protein [Hymenobacter crusticola]|uniref:Uncharacterized protein n=1 Tax=Hymenobacter crusticola TaxID=1770526 RepID=A0A243WH68_9BACT|nr:hypothetical protein [Hymenobacter crusticola]OUJ75149.1 hypothetical protein BXP70_03745 [Hymenobacter crusticola]